MPTIEQISSSDFYIERERVKVLLPNMHRHRSFELYYLVKGQREYFIEDRFFMVNEGDVVLIPRQVFHRTAGEGGLRFLVHFSDAFLRTYFTGETVLPLLQKVPFVFRGDATQQERILSLLDAMLTEYNRATQQQRKPDELLCSGLLYQLLFLLAHGKNTYVPHKYADVRITQIIQYINENYNQITDISQIAEQFYISKYHLCRFFRKSLGIPLMSYLNSIKISKACEMIKGGYGNMTKVAIDCGFNSSSYFCKVFKKEKGISPSEYRKKHKFPKAPQ